MQPFNQITFKIFWRRINSRCVETAGNRKQTVSHIVRTCARVICSDDGCKMMLRINKTARSENISLWSFKSTVITRQLYLHHYCGCWTICIYAPAVCRTTLSYSAGLWIIHMESTADYIFQALGENPSTYCVEELGFLQSLFITNKHVCCDKVSWNISTVNSWIAD